MRQAAQGATRKGKGTGTGNGLGARARARDRDKWWLCAGVQLHVCVQSAVCYSRDKVLG